MRKTRVLSEGSFFTFLASSCLVSSALILLLRQHLHSANPRVLYGLNHVPGALAAGGVFVIILSFLYRKLITSSQLRPIRTLHCIIILAIAFCIYWGPVVLLGGFVQDDWRLLAASSIRSILYMHPTYSLFTLDTVDGNFRPLGTALYFGYMLKVFGVCPLAFLTGNFLVNLSSCIVVYLITRELGYPRLTAMAASLLYMSRGINYTLNAWACAIGDGVSILLCGVAALLVLRASRLKGSAVLLFHLLAWCLFACATLAKQSSFAFPFIVGILIFVAPGKNEAVKGTKRLFNAIAAFSVYSATAAIVYFHAKALAQGVTPYAVQLSVRGFSNLFSYVTWYFYLIVFPNTYTVANLLPIFLGVAIVFSLALLFYRLRGKLGSRPRDIAFLLLASMFSIGMFALLPTRNAPYYGSMFAFWISIAIAICLTSFGKWQKDNPRARVCCFVFFLLIVSGFVDIRLKQTGLFPSGGYIWGTYGMDHEMSENRQLSELLKQSPQHDTLVYVSSNNNGIVNNYISMALLNDPNIQRIYVYDRVNHLYFSNSLLGARPKNDFGALTSPQAYSWDVPVTASEFRASVSCMQSVWVELSEARMNVVPCELTSIPR